MNKHIQDAHNKSSNHAINGAADTDPPQLLNSPFRHLNNLPNNTEMAISLLLSLADFTRHGFPTVDKEILHSRLEICKGCEFWDDRGFKNTGRCTKCGCSTQAKLRMATEKCPINKW